MDILSALIPNGLCVTGVSLECDKVAIHAQIFSDIARCPVCDQLSSRVHSRYRRRLADLPWGGLPVCFWVSIRRFYCANDFCPRKVFAERLHGVAKEYARRTDRQKAALEDIAFALGGEAGSRLAERLGLFISPDTLLRYIRNTRDPEVSTVVVLGVDDWAWRRRLRYGTILVDLERHRVIDLLEDRSAISFANWLNDHGEVSIISRDRGGEYKEGANRGVPQAVQVADRFHLIKNFSEATLKVFMRHVSLFSRVTVPDSPKMLSPPRADWEESRERMRTKIAGRYEAIRSLSDKGMSKNAISRALGLDRKTVTKYLRADSVPGRSSQRRASGILAPYENYILERLRQGYWNSRGLWREIMALGYSGGYQTVSRLVRYFRELSADESYLVAPVQGLTPRKALGLLLRRPHDRSEEQESAIDAIRGINSELGQAVDLFERFVQLVRRQPNENLNEWITRAENSGISEIERFVIRLRKDLEAVVAGLELTWSQGQTEGQVTRLKLIRRQMYGRGNFDLLRKRVMRAA